MRAPVRIVFEPLHFCGDAVFIALEVDDPIVLLVAATLVPHRNAAVRVAARALRLALHQTRERLALVQTRGDDLDELTTPGRSRFDFD